MAPTNSTLYSGLTSTYVLSLASEMGKIIPYQLPATIILLGVLAILLLLFILFGIHTALASTFPVLSHPFFQRRRP
jgi:hypothetical protein